MNPDSQEPDELSYYIKPKPRPRVVEMVLDLWHKLVVALSPSRSLKPDPPPHFRSESRPAPLSLFNDPTPDYSKDSFEQNNSVILYDEPSGRMIDTENGDYLTSELRESEKRERNFTLCDERDRTLLCAVVSERHIDELGGSRGAQLISYVLTKAWIPTDQPDAPSYFDEDHLQIDRLAAFLKARHQALGHKPPHSYFEFIDGRSRSFKPDLPPLISEPRPAPWLLFYKPTPVYSRDYKFGLKVGASLHLLFVLYYAVVLFGMRTTQRNLLFEFFFGTVFFLFAMGIKQWLYLLPTILYAFYQRRTGMAAGLFALGVLTFLLPYLILILLFLLLLLLTLLFGPIISLNFPMR